MRFLPLALLTLTLAACAGPSAEELRAAQEDYLRARGQTPEQVAAASERTARLDSLRAADPAAYAAEVAPAAPEAEPMASGDRAILERIERNTSTTATATSFLAITQAVGIIATLLLLIAN